MILSDRTRLEHQVTKKVWPHSDLRGINMVGELFVEDPAVMKPEVLLAHADFVRALARSLVVDEHRAEDIAQQTWLAALQHPPAEGCPVRSWLARVVRNFVRRRHRSETRRQTREKAAARGESLPSPAEIVEVEEVRQRMIAALLDLDEPYRSALLLRYYENIPPREIARRLDLHVEAVKTRLKRGLSQLRKRLDAGHDGDRSRWCLALAPLAGLKLAAPGAAGTVAAGAASASGKLSASFIGAITMSTKIKIFGAAILVLGLAAVSFSLLTSDPDGRSDRSSKSGATGSSAGITGTVNADSEPIDGTMEREKIEEVATAPSLPADPAEAANASGATLEDSPAVRGVVIDEAVGMPLRKEGAAVGLIVKDTDVRMSRVNPEDGTFLFKNIPDGTFDLILAGPGIYWRYHSKAVTVKKQRNTKEVHLSVPPMGEIRLMLTGFSEVEKNALRINLLPEQGRDPELPGSWPGLGKSILVPEGSLLVRVSHKELGSVEHDIEIEPDCVFELMIQRGDLALGSVATITLKGRLTRTDGTPVAFARISFSPSLGSNRAKLQCETDHDGRFQLYDFKPGRWSAYCILVPPSLLDLIKSRTKRDDMKASAPAIIFDNLLVPDDPPESFSLDLVIPDGRISGVLIDQFTGLPVDRELVSWKAILRDFSQGMRTAARATGIGESRFELTGIHDGSYTLIVAAFGYEIFQLDDVVVAHGAVRDPIEIKLKRTGVAEIDVRDPAGRRIKGFSAFRNGQSMGDTTADILKLPSGRTFFSNLPFETVTIEIRAYGYRSREITLKVEPHEPARAAVVLEEKVE